VLPEGTQQSDMQSSAEERSSKSGRCGCLTGPFKLLAPRRQRAAPQGHQSGSFVNGLESGPCTASAPVSISQVIDCPEPGVPAAQAPQIMLETPREQSSETDRTLLMPRLDDEVVVEVKPLGTSDVVQGSVEDATAPIPTETEDLVLPQPQPVNMTAAVGMQQPAWQVADLPRHKLMPAAKQSFEPVVRSPYTMQQVFAPNATLQTQLFPAKQTAPLVVSPRLAPAVHTHTTSRRPLHTVPAPLQSAHLFPVVPALCGQLTSPCHGTYSVTSATPRTTPTTSATPRTTPTRVAFATPLSSPVSKEVFQPGFNQTKSPVAGPLSTRISL